MSTETSMRGIFAVAALSFFGCSASDSVACRVGADCASGICGGDGTCAAPSKIDAGGSNLDGAADAPTDGPVTSKDGEANDGGVCAPNNDGIITRAEAPFGPGLHATFLVAQNVAVDTAGVANTEDGTRTWDYTAALTGDHKVLVDTAVPTGQWFSSAFPSATYTAPLSAASNLLGVFKTTPSTLLLLGVVSPDSPDAGTQTEITYATPITTLSFPLQKAATWTTTSNVTATVGGVTTYYSETYTSTIDATGTLITPFGTFKVLRVGVVLARNFVTTVRSFVFMTECFTTVARVVSNNYETTAEFTTASEIQRLSP